MTHNGRPAGPSRQRTVNGRTASARRFITPTVPALLAVQASALTGPQARAGRGDIPAHEEVVVLPGSLLESYATKRR